MNQLGPLLIPKATIAEKVAAMGKQLSREFIDRELVLVVVLKGALCFAADLIRHLSLPFTLECIQATSYRGVKSENLSIFFSDIDLKDKDVLVIDDICDSGGTLLGILMELEKLSPKSIQTVVLLNKKVSGKLFTPDYHLFDIDDYFVVGYGLDFREQFRGLPEIYVFRE